MLPLLLTLIAAQDVAPRIAAVSESLVGKPAPPIHLTLVNGAEFDLADYKGKIVFLAFWATWCEPCRREIPRLLHAEGNYKDLFVLVVLGISAESREDVSRYLAEERFDFRTAIDPGKTVSNAYGIDLVPRLFVIDQKGIVVKMIRGLPGDGTITRRPGSTSGAHQSPDRPAAIWLTDSPGARCAVRQLLEIDSLSSDWEALLQRHRLREGKHKTTWARPVAVQMEPNRNIVGIRTGNRLDGIDDDPRLLVAQQIG